MKGGPSLHPVAAVFSITTTMLLLLFFSFSLFLALRLCLSRAPAFSSNEEQKARRRLARGKKVVPEAHTARDAHARRSKSEGRAVSISLGERDGKLSTSTTSKPFSLSFFLTSPTLSPSPSLPQTQQQQSAPAHP